MNNFDNNGSNGSNGSNDSKGFTTINASGFSGVSRAFVTKMGFIHNALESGWSVKKNKESYIFTKKHEGKKEMFSDSYLSTFVKDNLEMANTIF